MKIRRASPTDLNEILTLFRETINEVNKKDYNSEQLEVWSSGADEKDRWLAKIHDTYFIVAHQKGHITGFGSLFADGYLDTLFIHKDHQGEGIGNAIVDQLLEHAQGLGLNEVKSEVSITARTFFEGKGFKVINEQSVNRKGVRLTNFKVIKKLG